MKSVRSLVPSGQAGKLAASEIFCKEFYGFGSYYKETTEQIAKARRLRHQIFKICQVCPKQKSL